MKQPFTYSVLRYVHDAVTGEFANVGVVLSCPAMSFVEARFQRRYRRISELFAKEVNGPQFRHMIRSLQERFQELTGDSAGRPHRDAQLTDAMEIARRILPLDDSALQFHRGGAGTTDDPPSILAYLFERYVTRYILGRDRRSRTDEEVLSVLQESLHEADLGSKVHPFDFESVGFTHTFPVSWRNGRVNVCEPLSFDLLEAQAIHNKAYRWVGRSKSIREADRTMRLIFFLGLPINTRQKRGFEEGREILERFVEGEHLVVDEDQTGDLLRTVMAESH